MDFLTKNQRRSRGELVVVVFFLSCLGASCTSSEESVFKAGSAQKKPASQLTSNAARDGNIDGKNSSPNAVASATYGIRLKSNSGARLCEGEVEFQILSNFTINFPQAEVRCLSLKINLGGILAAVSSNAYGSGDLKSDGTVISISKIAGAEFTPARPVLLGPIVQDRSKFSKFNSVTDHTVRTKDINGSSISAQGSFRIEVLNEKTTYSNKYLKKPFDDILHWQITTSGFEKVPPQNGLLFKKIEWFFNTRPIMIPQINIVGDLSGFLQDDEKGVGALVGDFEINLVVMKHKMD